MKVQEKLKNQAAETEAVLALATYVCLYFSLSSLFTIFASFYFVLTNSRLSLPLFFVSLVPYILSSLSYFWSLLLCSLSLMTSLNLCAFVYTVFSPDQLAESFPLWGNFPHVSHGKEFACSAGDLGLITGSARSPGEGNDNALQSSCLEDSMDRGAWQATVHGVAESQT